MDMQAEAERRKRATVLDSEGAQQSEINVAEGARQSTILQAEGEAAAIVARARATAKGIELLAAALRRPGGREAVSLGVAEKYVEAFGQIAQKGNTMLLPANAGDPAAMGTNTPSMDERGGRASLRTRGEARCWLRARLVRQPARRFAHFSYTLLCCLIHVCLVLSSLPQSPRPLAFTTS